MTNNEWRIWNNAHNYGEVLFNRATGISPEMESSKATAKVVKYIITEGDTVLDVGCGVGHYLRSLKRAIPFDFFYTGIDATPAYVKLAKKAFENYENAGFVNGDIFGLPFGDKTHDIVMSCNVLLHLPSIEIPLRELCRVARKFVLIRTMVGNRSFIIKDVHDNGGHDFNTNGEPLNFHYYNIYSEKYIRQVLDKLDVANVEISEDRDYLPENITAAISEQSGAMDVTAMFGDWQVNGYVLQPWAFVKITVK